MTIRAVMVLVVLMIPFAMCVGAQGGPDGEVEESILTLWAHRNASDPDELSGWLSELREEGDDTAMGPLASCENSTTSLTPGIPMTGNRTLDDALFGADVNRLYNLTLAAPSGTMELNSSKMVLAVIFFGAGSCAGYPDLTVTVYSGASLIANGSANHAYRAGVPYANQTLNLTVQNTTLSAGSPLRIQIRVNGTYYGAGFLGIGEQQGRTKFSFPLDELVVPEPANTTANTTELSPQSNNPSSSANSGATNNHPPESSPATSTSTSTPPSHDPDPPSFDSTEQTGKSVPGFGLVGMLAVLAASGWGRVRRRPKA